VHRVVVVQLLSEKFDGQVLLSEQHGVLVVAREDHPDLLIAEEIAGKVVPLDLLQRMADEITPNTLDAGHVCAYQRLDVRGQSLNGIAPRRSGVGLVVASMLERFAGQGLGLLVQLLVVVEPQLDDLCEVVVHPRTR